MVNCKSSHYKYETWTTSTKVNTFCENSLSPARAAFALTLVYGRRCWDSDQRAKGIFALSTVVPSNVHIFAVLLRV